MGRKAQVSPLVGLTAKVAIERNGAAVSIEDVPAQLAFSVLAELLDALRVAVKAYPELTAELSSVCGGSIEYSEHEDFEGKRVGFT